MSNCSFSISVNGTDQPNSTHNLRSLQFALSESAKANLTEIVICYDAGDFDALAFHATVPLQSLALLPTVELRGEQTSQTRAVDGVNVTAELNLKLITQLTIVDVFALDSVSVACAALIRWERGAIQFVDANTSLAMFDATATNVANSSQPVGLVFHNATVRGPGALQVRSLAVMLNNSYIASDLLVLDTANYVTIVNSTVARANETGHFLNVSLSGAVSLVNVEFDGVDFNTNVELDHFVAHRMVTGSIKGMVFSNGGYVLSDSSIRSCPNDNDWPVFSAFGKIPENCTSCLLVANTSLPNAPCRAKCPPNTWQMHTQLGGLAYCVSCPDGLAVAQNGFDCEQCRFGFEPSVTGHGCAECSPTLAWSAGTCNTCDGGYVSNRTCISLECTSFSVVEIFHGRCPFDSTDVLVSIAVVIIVCSILGGIAALARKFLAHRSKRKQYHRLAPDSNEV